MSCLNIQNSEEQMQNMNILPCEITSATSVDGEETNYIIRLKRILNEIKKWLINNFNSIYGHFLHIYFIIVFEILFYFNYVINVERGEITRVLDAFAISLMQYMEIYINEIPNNDPNIIMDMCDNLHHNYVDKNNAKLKSDAYDIIWTLSIFLILIIVSHLYLVSDIKKLINKSFEALIFIGFIAIFEYYFFTNIITKYNIMTNDEAICYLYDSILND